MNKILAQCKMLVELLESCNEKLELEPDNMEIVKLRGLVFNAAQLYDEAIKDLNDVIQNLPNDESSYYLRSDCNFNKKEFDLAKRDYMRALKIQFKDDDKEFASGYTEEVIEASIVGNEKELESMKKVLEYEKKRVLLSYIPHLNMNKE